MQQFLQVTYPAGAHFHFAHQHYWGIKMRIRPDCVFSGVVIIAVQFAALTAVQHVAAADELFPDKNLEKVVRQYVFEKRNNDKPLVEKDVENISTIEAKNAGVKNLAGLEKCRSLLLLDLEGSMVTDLAPLKELTGIQSLNLARNQVTDASPLSGLTALQYLHLADNKLTDLTPLAGLKNLRTLELSGNQITDLKPLSGLEKIWSLYLDKNQITDLAPLSGLKSLATLGLNNNQVKDLTPLSGIQSWSFLFLQDNQLKNVNVLVDMAKKDTANRFAPFWRIYLSGNPLDNDPAESGIEPLKKTGARVFLNE